MSRIIQPSLLFDEVIPANTRKSFMSAFFQKGAFIRLARITFRVGAANELRVFFFEESVDSIPDNLEPQGTNCISRYGGVQYVSGENETKTVILLANLNVGKRLCVHAWNMNTTYTRTLSVVVDWEL